VCFAGLAQGAVHSENSSSRIPTSFFEGGDVSEVLDRMAARLKSVILSGEIKPVSSGLHAFTILARILKDPEFGTIVDSETTYTTTVERFGDALRKLIDEWQVDTTNVQNVERKIEELSWMNVIIYGIGGWQEGQPFNADFLT
jgi:hypothetical protein